MKATGPTISRACLFLACSLALFAIGSEVRSENLGPGWHNATAQPVSSEAADSYYAQAQKGATARLAASREPGGVSLEATMSSATEATAEITELARGLLHDPKLIYDYVHNHIDYVPYFGSLKGATLTYLDGSGNDFDQASLMIALLRASGFTAKYQYGTMDFAGGTDSPLANWVGSSDNYPSILASGGVPFSWAGTHYDVTRVWVKATIGGTDYPFDPAYKTYTTASKIDIGQALGYNRADLLAAAGGTVASDGSYVQNLNESALAAKLTQYATNFINTIRSQHPNDSIDEILGRRSVDQSELTQLPTTLPFPSAVTATWDDVPAGYVATLRVQHVGIDYTFQIPELAGGRLTITYASGDHHPELRLDGTLIASGNPTTTGSLYGLILTVDHPYADDGGTYCDQSTTYQNKSGGTYAIVYNFGGSSEAIITKRQKKADEYIANGLAADSEAARGEALNIAGLSWLRQVSLAGGLVCQLADTMELTHHRIGRMGQESNSYIDVATAVSSLLSRSLSGSGETPTFCSITSMASSIEHAIVEQAIRDSEAVSTVKCLQIANSRGQKIFRATCANFDSIRPQLQNYTASQLNSFRSNLCSGQVSWYLLPQDGGLLVNSWTGTGYIERRPNSIGMIIQGGLSGGYCTSDGCYILLTDLDGNLYWVKDPSTESTTEKKYSFEPVEMSNGAYVHDRTDLSMGGTPPLGVGFARSYNSSRNLSSGLLGNGWTHSLDLRVATVSDPGPPLGSRSAVDASGLVAALYATLDLHAAEGDARGWTVAALLDKWATDHLAKNVAVVERGGQVMRYVKLPDGSYQGPSGVTTQLVDNHDGTFSLVERLGSRVNFGADGRATSLVDVDGNTMTFTYNGSALSRVQDAAGRSIILAYSGDRLMSVSDSAGRSVSYGYDASGNLTSCTDPENQVWTYAYDTQHRMTSITNPLPVTTITNSYDSLGRVASQTAPRQGGATATYNFYFSGFSSVEEDPLGNKIVYFYDVQSRYRGMIDALGNRVAQTYDGQNHVVETSDPKQNKTTFSYDGDQNLLTLTDATNQSSSYTYDAQFRLTGVKDALQHGETFAYDTKHHLVSTMDALGNVNSNTYYPNGLVHTITDARATVTTAAYDAYGQLASSQVGSRPPVQFVYDAIGRLTSLTDKAGSSTFFVSDKRGLLTSRTDSLGGTVLFSYDGSERLVSATDRKGQTVTYSYTPSGKVSTVTLPGGSQIVYTYDSRDNLVGSQDQLGTTTYTYDALNRLSTLTDPRGFALAYTYDQVGNIATVTYPGSKTVTYSYDAVNRMKTVTNWLGQTAACSYDIAGHLASLTNFNGTLTTYGRDDANRLIDLQSRKSTHSIATYRFGLDANGNRISVTQYEPYAPQVNPAAVSYSYNTQRNRLLAAGTTSYTWDFEGELSGIGGTPYIFDSLHRLVSVGGANSTQYVYDGLNRRIQATRGGVVSRYVYDAAGNLIAEADGANNLTAYYVYGARLLARITPAGSTMCYHFNAVGSTVAMTDMGQSVVNKYAYDPFGNVVAQVETVPQPFKFVGQYGVTTEPGGLQYMRARYYDPVVGRFISEDPLGFAGGDFNLCLYSAGNPVNWLDPWGLAPGDPYSSADKAGEQALRDINSKSISEGVEYNGRVYKNKDGTYSYTAPNKGTQAGSSPGPWPAGTTNAGRYHTHGNDALGPNGEVYDNENYSDRDKENCYNEGVPGYLGTPGGDIKKWAPGSSAQSGTEGKLKEK